jgi:hypothetical protein
MLNKGIARKHIHDAKGRGKGMARRPRSDDAAVVLVNMCEDAGWETNTYTGILSGEVGLGDAGDRIPLHAFCVTSSRKKDVVKSKYQIRFFFLFREGNYSVKKRVPAVDAHLWPGGGMRYVNLQLVGSPPRAFDPFRCRYLDGECDPTGEPCSGVYGHASGRQGRIYMYYIYHQPFVRQRAV